MKNKVTLIIMAVLLIITFTQAFIIMDYYLDELKLGIFNISKEGEVFYRSYDSIVRTNYLIPFKMFINLDDSRITEITTNESDFYYLLWEDSKIIMDSVLKRDPDKKLNSESWISISALKGVSLRYNDFFPINFIAWMMEVESNTLKKEKISNILITVNDNDLVDVYLKTTEGIYFYSSLDAQGLFKNNNFSNLVDYIKTNTGYINRRYSNSRVLFVNSRLRIEPDIPVIIRAIDENNGYRVLEFLRVKPLPLIAEYNDILKESKKPYENNDLINKKASDIKIALFGKSEDRYKTVINSEGNIFYTNQYNIYEVSPEGGISYVYTQGHEGMEKGNMENAFINALDMIHYFYNLNSNMLPNIYISGVKETDDYYEFTFNYIYEDKPVLFKDMLNAITIKATATRTIAADMMVLDITGVKDVTAEYDAELISIIQKNGVNILTLDSSAMYIGYQIDVLKDSLLLPVWFNEKSNKTRTAWEMVR